MARRRLDYPVAKVKPLGWFTGRKKSPGVLRRG
jgi:hypothetical protein